MFLKNNETKLEYYNIPIKLTRIEKKEIVRLKYYFSIIQIRYTMYTLYMKLTIVKFFTCQREFYFYKHTLTFINVILIIAKKFTAPLRLL